MTIAPFSPGPDGSVIDDSEISLSGAAEILEDDLGFALRRGQVVEVTIRGEIGSTTEVDKTVSGGRAVTVRRWSIKVNNASDLKKIADPPDRNADGQIPGQTTLGEDIVDAGVEGGLSDADEKARATPADPPSPEELERRKAEIAAHQAASADATSDATPETIGEDARANATGAVVFTMPSGEQLTHGQRWMTPEGKTFVVQSAGKEGDKDVIVGYYEDSHGQDAFPPQSFGATLANVDVITKAKVTPPKDPTAGAPAQSASEVKETLSDGIV